MAILKKIKIGSTYQHYKNKEYKVIGIAKHSETLEYYVIYECLYPNELSKIWVRPASLFTDKVVVDGKEVPRFKLIR